MRSSGCVMVSVLLCCPPPLYLPSSSYSMVTPHGMPREHGGGTTHSWLVQGIWLLSPILLIPLHPHLNMVSVCSSSNTACIHGDCGFLLGHQQARPFLACLPLLALGESLVIMELSPDEKEAHMGWWPQHPELCWTQHTS